MAMESIGVFCVSAALLALVVVCIVLAVSLRGNARDLSDREKQMIDTLANIASNESQVRRQEVAIAPHIPESVYGRMTGQPQPQNNGRHIPVDAEAVEIPN